MFSDAEAYCPTRWKAIQRWFKHNVRIMVSAKPYVQELFYTKGENKTTPDCLVRLTAEYNPSNGKIFISFGKNKKKKSFVERRQKFLA